MVTPDIEARKLYALQKTVQYWLDRDKAWYTPNAVSDLFARYQTLKERLVKWMPEILGDLNDQVMLTEDVFNGHEEVSMVARDRLEVLNLDIDYFLRLVVGFLPPKTGQTVLHSELSTATDSRNVFVIHGRNEKVRTAMFEFLRSLGLHPMEWLELLHSTESATPYIGEVLQTAFRRAQAVVALLTPDDLAKLHPEFQQPHDADYEKKLTGQARPNVLFETGMALGRAPDRTVIVIVGETRPFSDISGLHVVRLTNSVVNRQSLVARLQKCGCPVDSLTGTDWQSAGDFALNMGDGVLQQVDELVKKTVSDLPPGKYRAVSKQAVIEAAVREGLEYSQVLSAIDNLIERKIVTLMPINGSEELWVK